MHRIADDRLHQKSHEPLGVAVDRFGEWPAAVHLALKGADAHDSSLIVWHFHHCAGKPPLAAEQRVDADEPFVPDSRNLERSAISHDAGDRIHSAPRKIDPLQGLSWFEQDVLKREGHGFEDWKETSVVSRRQSGEEPVWRSSCRERAPVVHATLDTRGRGDSSNTLTRLRLRVADSRYCWSTECDPLQMADRVRLARTPCASTDEVVERVARRFISRRKSTVNDPPPGPCGFHRTPGDRK